MSKDNIDVGALTKELQEKYPDAGIQTIEVDGNTGKSTFYLKPTQQNLAFLDPNKGGGITPRIANQEKASTINRDYITRTALDLSSQPGPLSKSPHELFKIASNYYYSDPLVGPVTNLLASFALEGFENDIDDPKLKDFYDRWLFDVNMEEVLEWVFLDFFKVGHVVTYKVLSDYKPGVSYLPGKEKTATGKKDQAARKKIWSKNHIPTSYTVLNPAFVKISGNLLFNKVSTAVTFPESLTKILNKSPSDLSEDEKELIKTLPNDLKAAAKKGEEYSLDSRLVGHVTYRKQPYERYAKPRITRIFDSLEYKKALKNADLSTLDGISNYILQITIGNDEYPVTSQTELEAVAKLFNTPSKSFDVVWNHTLEIKKIVSPEIEAILGKGKYEQVVDDITTGLAMSRAFLDGGGDLTGPEAELLVKGLKEEINYARKQVERWLYREYRQIATIMGFKRFPKIRWDEGILLDTILFMNTLAQLVDRRMLSYRTSLEALGFDYSNELRNMKEEVPLVKKGTFGILGSPWQKSSSPSNSNNNNNNNVEPPDGVPSSGPPKGTVRQKNIDPKKVTKKSDTSPNQQKRNLKTKQAANFDIKQLASLPPSEYAAFLDGARSRLSDEDYVSFVEDMTKYRLLG